MKDPELLYRLGPIAAELAWPDQPLQPGEQVSVRFVGDIDDPDFTAEVLVHRNLDLVRHMAYAGWDGVSFMLRWADAAQSDENRRSL